MINYFLWIYILSSILPCLMVWVAIQDIEDSEDTKEVKDACNEIRQLGNFSYIIALLPIFNTIMSIIMLIPITEKYLLPKK